MSYSETMTIRTRDCDCHGHWKPSAIMEALQEVAIGHCESIGVGRAATDAQGVVWVLSRCRVELARTPAWGETLRVETFALPVRHLFFPRGHVVYDAEGNAVAGSLGLWLLLDTRTRRATDNAFVRAHLPHEDREAPAGTPGAVRTMGGEAVCSEILPQFSEFDLNVHVNNARYLDWCWNALGFEGLEGREIAEFTVNYDREVRPGQRVEASLTCDGDRFAFCGSEGGQRCFAVGGMLRKSPD